MTMYAEVIDGVIVKTQGSLPVSTSRVSNFYLLPEEERRTHGWFTVTESPEPSYDPVTEYLDATQTTLVNGVPVSTRAVVAKTLDNLKAELLARGKEVAERAIQNDYSTQEQIAALANLTSAPHRAAVVAKIQSVYGAFMTFRTAVNAAATPADVKAVWESYPALQGGN